MCVKSKKQMANIGNDDSLIQTVKNKHEDSSHAGIFITLDGIPGIHFQACKEAMHDRASHLIVLGEDGQDVIMGHWMQQEP